MITATITTEHGREVSRTFETSARAERWILAALGDEGLDGSIYCHGVTVNGDTGETEEYEY